MVLGIDQSLTSTALVLLNDSLKIVDHVVIQPKSKGVNRLLEITNCLTGFAGKRTSVWGLEGYNYGFQKGLAFQLGELGGLIKIAAHQLIGDNNLVIVPPSTRMKYATGKGNAKKDIVLGYCLKKWGIDFLDEAGADDLADAYVIGRVAHHFDLAKRGFPLDDQGLLAYERDAISALLTS